MVDEWYQRIPVDERGDLKSRFQSKDSLSTHAAFWEIYLHEALLRHGFKVTVHPPISGSVRSPDFLAESHASSFYLEATCYFEKDRTSAEERRRERLYDAINQLWNANFHVWIDIESEGASSPPGAPLRNALDRWLKSLDPDEVNASHDPGSMFDLPSFTWERDGWTISFWAIPIKPEARGKPDSQLIGVYGTGDAKFIDDKTPIRSRLGAKAKRYGQLNRPFVIALSCHTMFVDHISIVDALYGDEAVQFGHNAKGEVVTRSIRHPNGFWRGPSGPRNRRVSAVLMGRNINPWSVTERAPVMWHHPFANHPLEADLVYPSQRVELEHGQIVESEGARSMNEFLELPSEWPGPEEAFPDD
ncbi:MAG: hypothetical protein GEU71_04600 [Actinobacteria bacterium]|nr:hypothetical protein [Actinomycetota bacterium]